METFDDFAAIEGTPGQPTVIVWDELPLYFNARKWAEFPDAMLYKFTQIRKDGLQLYYSAIHEAMIDVNIRRVTFWYWRCRAITGRVLYRTLWPPEEYRKAGQRARRRETVIVRESVAGAYDTTRHVALPVRIRERVARGVPELARWSEVPLVGRVPSGVADEDSGPRELEGPGEALRSLPDGDGELAGVLPWTADENGSTGR